MRTMTSNLYNEALADAKKLREIAEQNAKNAIIESITPKIRELIESQIINEEFEDDSDIIEEAFGTDSDSEEFDLTPEAVNELKSLLTKDDKDPQLPVNNEISKKEKSLIASSESVKECNEYLESLDEVVSKIRNSIPADLNENELQKYIALVAVSDKALEKLEEMVSNIDSMQIFESVIKNSHDQIQEFKKEINKMKRSLRDLLSEEVITIELDLGEEAEVDPTEAVVSVVLDEEGEEEEELDLDSEAEEAEAEEAEAEEAEAEEAEDEEELDLESLVAEMDHDEEMEEGEEDLMETLDDDTVLEISEDMLREELAKLVATTEATESSEETVNENKEDGTTAVADEQNDALRSQIDKYEEATVELKAQLAEMNLFNAKLLYTNKLLMNSDLSQSQRAQAIETLDDAASLREVKLLFKTLTESFGRRAEVKSTSRNIGGASRPTGSASMNLNENKEATRWATLAGINN